MMTSFFWYNNDYKTWSQTEKGKKQYTIRVISAILYAPF
jgi:hypothetical protein